MSSLYKYTRSAKRLFNDKFLSEVRSNPLVVYQKFYDNQYKSQQNSEVLRKILPDFDKIEKEQKLTPRIIYELVIRYIDSVHDFTNDKSRYHYSFTKDVLKDLFRIGDNTQLIFTFDDLTSNFLVDVRPLCLYINQLLDVSKETHKCVEGNELDAREFTYHDLGHSYVMKRQDIWLFNTINRDAIDLVKEWIINNNWYKQQMSIISDINLYNAVRLYLFDIVHDRGYQFYLPILKQQILATKNLENIKTKLLRGNFDNAFDKNLIHYINDAQRWLLDATNELILEDNLAKIDKYALQGYVIKKYPNVESYHDIPLYVTIEKNTIIKVVFKHKHHVKSTSLYEVELLSIPVSEPILTKDKIDTINANIDLLNADNISYLKLDCDANIFKVINTDSKRIQNSTKYHLKGIEIYKLQRVLKSIKMGTSLNFSVTSQPTIYESDKLILNNDNKVTIDTGLVFNLNEISVEPKRRQTLKYINLDSHARFVPEDILRRSYIRNPNCSDAYAKPWVEINHEYELGIVDTSNFPEIAKAVSSLLSRSIDDAKNIYPNGYLPDYIVKRAQLEYVSPYAISNLWGKSGYRFVLSRTADNYVKEIVATALVADSKDTLFFFTNKYNNVRFSSISDEVDFNLKIGNRSIGEYNWFDKFRFPKIIDYKPAKYNQIANVTVEKSGYRNLGLSKLLITNIIKHYALHFEHVNINHSQPLICGKGLIQYADPSWRPLYGFELRAGAETFYIDQEWDRLPPIIINDKSLSNVEYNALYGLPQIYENKIVNNEEKIHLIERIPEVINLSKSDYAKLQYRQYICSFDKFRE